MKRIVITLAALAISTSGIALAEDLEDYGSVLGDPVAKSSSYNAPDTYLENHGSVLLDRSVPNRRLPRTMERGMSHEISIGDSATIFESDPDDPF